MKNKMLFSVLSVLLVLLLFLPHVFAQDTVVRVEPSSVEQLLFPQFGDEIQFNVLIENGQNVAGYQVMLDYDSSVLELVSYSKGDYLPAGTFYGKARKKPLFIGNSGILSGQKRVQFAATSSPQSQSGDGTLVTLTFKLLSLRTSSLNFVAGDSSSGMGHFSPTRMASCRCRAL